MDCAEIHLSSHIFTNVQVWIQIKKAGGGIGGGRSASPKAEWQYLSVLLCAVEYGIQGFCVYM